MSKQDDTLLAMAQGHEDDRLAQAAANAAKSLEKASERPLDEFTVTIDLSNDIFQGEQGRHELARILTELAERVTLHPFTFGTDWRTDYPCLRDVNGNTVGEATISRS